MSRKRGLGSGLDALIPSTTTDQTMVRELPVTAIRANRAQPRTSFDETALAELAASVQAHGVLQPLIVSEDPAGGYELIAGERRWRAARMAGLTTVPAIVKNATPQQFLELALVENVQRADLNPLEEAQAYETLRREFGLSDEEIARRVGKSRVAIVNSRRLLRLTPTARQALLDGVISAGHGRALLRLEDPADQQAALELIKARELSVRDVERLAELVTQPGLVAATRNALCAGQIEPAQALALQQLADPQLQATACEAVMTHRLNRAETERFCAALAAGTEIGAALAEIRSRSSPIPPTLSTREPPDRIRSPMGASPEDRMAQQMFEELLQTPVQIARSGKTIRVTITLYGDEQLQGLYDRLAGS
ncbi:ParB/RepB/Spo0J family partition protein [Chloroflexus sp.]|uniref:ParB/RepB/Spo0J family partition protein n=1 Tax=Chloroflexus sp. TaxID=1904827 RepID=UPI0026315A2B|nr:ParB/RepB/Spo0J family partition protein [uncultured Chloroflexus sp.]